VQAADPHGPSAAGPVSDRVRVARVALAAALEVDGVAAAHVPALGPPSTQSSGGRVEGVTAVAGEGGRYEVGLHLVARPVPLHPLGERVRRRVVGAVARAGLAERLGPVSVFFEDLAAPSRAVDHAAPDTGPAEPDAGPATPETRFPGRPTP
jgi:hypothetical protein